MTAYRDALVVDDASSEQRLGLAVSLLNDGSGVVMLEGVAALRSTPTGIICEVVDRSPGSHRCMEELKVLVENAARALAGSRLAARLPARPMQWVVVEDCGSGTVELWRAP